MSLLTLIAGQTSASFAYDADLSEISIRPVDEGGSGYAELSDDGVTFAAWRPAIVISETRSRLGRARYVRFICLTGAIECDVIAESDYGKTERSKRQYTIGVYYFPGWSTPGGGPNAADPWSLITTYDATRNPILGQYNETLQSIANTHLGWMDRFGIDFVAYDWFMQWSGTTLQPYLDHAINNYLTAPVKKPKFCLQFANQTNAGGLTSSTWATVYNFWITHYFKDPNYYRVNNKPVVIVNSVPTFKTSIGTNAQVKAALAAARTAAIAAGLEGIVFMGGHANSSSAWTDVTTPEVEGWDGVTGSNIYTTTKVSDNSDGPAPTTYADLHNAVFSGVSGGYRGFCNGWLNISAVPAFWPPLTAGFNSAPWNSGSATLNGIPTLAQWIAHLVAGKALLDANPTKTQKTFVIEAWNEHGEGSQLEPTLGNGGFDRLRALKDIFER